ncbi:hypothetical protein HRbin02_00709 [Candidatus Calditenuaceae archaeon HR02]|nr:hypothetical protein HRbin02_00709 [Candidatus Calditenuaceae archaeon HR02]
MYSINLFDKYEKKGIITGVNNVFVKFIGETRLLTRLGQLKLVPLTYSVLIRSTAYFSNTEYIWLTQYR